MTNVYAASLFDIGLNNKHLDEIFISFKIFITCLDDNKDFKHIMISPIVEETEKLALIDKIEAQFNKDFVYFLRVLVKHNQINNIDDIFFDFKEMYYQYMHKLEVIILTNTSLTKEDITHFHAFLDQKYPDKEIIIEEKIDHSILCGFEVFIDHKRVSASLKAELENLKKEIL